ncbi:predicted protein [Plenodomus lingam JN3]|uniref:Predicted protein n=1 Tax=Leptosphaeria maculans (strain JN3 / isolate v23.1.3 / race Av1-4-5-6-7-8) TaxID=985895 RepID=E4ZP22_LEPMJ|nr:predicted protein [Plenodomus lingam JN3]CBX93391.1 predicted protein [Plenodomus lingam JN3]
MEQFQCHAYIAPWWKRWLKPHRQLMIHGSSANQQTVVLPREYESWLYVATQFGLEDDYVLLSDYMAWNCRLGLGDQIMHPTPDFTMHRRNITVPLIRIKSVRNDLMNELLAKFHKLLEDLQVKLFCRVVILPDEDQFMCTHLIGKRIRASMTRMSVKETLTVLQSIAQGHDPSQWPSETQNFTATFDPRHHVACNNVTRAINQKFEKVIAATDLELLAMRENAVRLGRPLSNNFNSNKIGKWTLPYLPAYGLSPDHALNNMEIGITKQKSGPIYSNSERYNKRESCARSINAGTAEMSETSPPEPVRRHLMPSDTASGRHRSHSI